MIENKKITDIPEGSEPLPTSGIVPVNKPKSNLAETQEKIKENVINLGKNLPVTTVFTPLKAAVPSTSKEIRIPEVASTPSPKKRIPEVPTTPATPSPNKKEIEEDATPVKKL